MNRGIGLFVLCVVVLGAVIVTTGGAQVYPVRWDEDQPEPKGAEPPSLVLADGDLQFSDGTVQVTAAGSGESLAAAPSPTLVLAEGGIQFPDGTVQATAAGSLVPRTGIDLCYDIDGLVIDCATDIGPGQDGDLQSGAPWPDPRFTINESSPGAPNGTVTDNLTGLIWLENADCAGGTMNWDQALTFANTLFDGSVAHNGGDCGLDDGSAVGAWRLPNLREIQSLLHYGVHTPSVPNTVGTGQWVAGDPFSDVQSAKYWSSTAVAQQTFYAWVVHIGDGYVDDLFFLHLGRVWPVRGGQ